jgi:hypothetical protein
MAAQLHTRFFETSALTSQMIGKVFDEITEIVAAVLEPTGLENVMVGSETRARCC